MHRDGGVEEEKENKVNRGGEGGGREGGGREGGGGIEREGGGSRKREGR